jgi:hypothetical protein
MAHSVEHLRRKNTSNGYTCFKDIGQKNGRRHIQTHTQYQQPKTKKKNKRLICMAGWQKNVIQIVWGAMIKLWKLQNDKRHGWDKKSRNRLQREVLHHKLAEIYGRKNEYPERVQRLLRTLYEEHTQETVTKIANWLEAYKGTFAITWSPD